MSKKVFVIGNGKSRLGFDLNALRYCGITIGCNALHRDFSPDYLVSVDPEVTREIHEEKRDFRHIYVYRKKDWKYRKEILRFENGQEIILKNTSGWDSGTTALYYSCYLENPKQVFMLGFDLYSDNGFQNNVYSDTQWYAKSDQPHPDWKLWVERQSQVFKEYYDVDFFRVGRETDSIPLLWKDLDNIKFISYKELNKWIGKEN